MISPLSLPFNLDDVINQRNVESNRMEYKSSWTKHIKNAVIRTICAFGNDFHNLNGGYIILGIIDKQGRPVLPLRSFGQTGTAVSTWYLGNP